MTRKQMIETIAKEAGCSKRLVRKKLFNRYLQLKKTCPHILFYKTFLDKNTNWVKFKDKDWNWRTPNVFEVAFFPSGCIVLFRNIDAMYDGELTTRDCGARLYSW